MPEEQGKQYNDTLNLPKTDFPMRGGLPQKEPDILQRMEGDDIYSLVQKSRAGRSKYILHDGPPYANGNIHLGHALNKVLKDMIVKYKTMCGFDSPYVPGWDTHGLPIEHRAMLDLGLKRHEIDTLVFREKCKEFALQFVETQRVEFKRLGVRGDWDHPYITLTPDFEEAQIRVFGEMAAKGYIYKGLKPVYWCPDCETSLAEAEIEYEDKKSYSIYVKFPLTDGKGVVNTKDVFVVIWTTTPWTIPANLAICLNSELTYVVVEAVWKEKTEYYLVAEALLEPFIKECGLSECHIVENIPGKDLEGLVCRHPYEDRDSVLVLGNHVTTDAGTGCVHTAPGHGAEDFDTGRRYGLDIFCPIDHRGVFTAEGGPVAGLFIDDANPVVVKLLEEKGMLLAKGSLTHQYPHCWRCKKPVMFRAAEQWFVSIDGFRAGALDAIDRHVDWVPSWGRERIHNMIADRGDWCISRQRTWGVPIPIFYCEQCGESVITPETVDKVAGIFGKEGSNAWWIREASELLPEGFACPKCGAHGFIKEKDIMDVWFDSGSSHMAVLDKRPELGWPSDMYLEGSDQHRGWFNSSLCTGMALRGQAPYKTVLTHGFLVDEQGRKQSKSVGNTVDPHQVIKDMGADILRLWVASVDYRNDMASSPGIMKQISETYRKMRNTVRFLLGNVFDFDYEKHKQPYSGLLEIDRWALDRLARVIGQVTAAFEHFEFHTAYHALHRFCTVEMSAFYLDIVKDRLYCEKADSPQRRSCQQVLWETLQALTLMLAPILTFTTEEIWQYLPQSADTPYAQLAFWPKSEDGWQDDGLYQKWQKLIEVREQALKVLEEARGGKRIGQSLEAKILLRAGKDAYAWLSEYEKSLADLFIVSQTELSFVDGDGLDMEVVPAEGQKCNRCWVYHTDVDDEGVCPRCAEVLAQIEASE
ncbi:MAG: isoleucine--tRNA ligase [Peptococcaceae bacterium]|jgi:isoleucyl-tRNA synthetase|nr:isoleucine--tRNA ligase [Peptococcaceae bacterium]